MHPASTVLQGVSYSARTRGSVHITIAGTGAVGMEVAVKTEPLCLPKSDVGQRLEFKKEPDTDWLPTIPLTQLSSDEDVSQGSPNWKKHGTVPLKFKVINVGVEPTDQEGEISEEKGVKEEVEEEEEEEEGHEEQDWQRSDSGWDVATLPLLCCLPLWM